MNEDIPEYMHACYTPDYRYPQWPTWEEMILAGQRRLKELYEQTGINPLGNLAWIETFELPDEG